MSKTAQIIAGAVKEALSLWKTFIATRQQAYERHMDKRQEAAIKYAEQAFGKMHVLFEHIYKNATFKDDEKSEYLKLKKAIYRLEKKFNKYD